MMAINKINSNVNSVGTETPTVIKKETRDPRMLEAAKGFENQFIRQMITEMRKTVPKDGLVDESMADDIFKDQLDDQYAEQWVGQGGIGLADMIYDQLYEKYGPGPAQPLQALNKSSSGMKGLQPQTNRASQAQGAPSITPPKNLAKNSVNSEAKPHDIMSNTDKKLFVMKLDPGVMTLKSKEPLPEKVSLRSPLDGVVLQAAALEDGRQMVVLRHDQGLVTRFVHSGDNRVKNNMKVAAGEVIAELPASKKGEGANVVFELRQTPKTE
jgi:Rod binding domain-containing protein